MKTLISTVKGTREFYPEEMGQRTWLYTRIRQVAESFGYQEYDGPFLEKLDLYAAKSGEELVKKQSFVFDDRGGDQVTLRPELTPSLARMVAQRQGELTFPLRWWSFGPFWRYEQPQRGRTREFFQWNIDMIGPNTPEADAELVAICAAFFNKVGLTPDQVVIRVNDRRLMDAQVQALGIPAERKADIFNMIDRREKMRPAEWDQYALDLGLTQTQLDGLKAMLANPELWQSSGEMVRFFQALDVLGGREYVVYDASVIRGLLYYTGTVFEAEERQKNGRAILGGGRYDNLVGDVGGSPVGGVGFAMGDVMMTLVLRDHGLIPTTAPAPAQVLVTVFDQDHLLASLGLASALRRGGVNAICYPEAAKLPKQLKFADKLGIRWAVILGPDEAARGEVVVKDLTQRTQLTVSQADFVENLREQLAQAGVV